MSVPIGEIIQLVDAIVKQVKEYTNNNVLCIRLSERAKAIGETLRRYLDQPNISLPCLPRVKLALEKTFVFIGKFQDTNSLSKFLFAGNYKDEFISLNSELTESLQDLTTNLATDIHTRPMADATTIANDVLARFSNSMPEYLCSKAFLANALVTQTAEIQRVFFEALGEEMRKQTSSILSQVQKLAEERAANPRTFQRAAPRKLKEIFAPCSEPPLQLGRDVSIDFAQRIGEGSFGIIVKGTLLTTKQRTVAVKLLNIQDAVAKQLFDREVVSLKRLSNCLFIVKYLGWIDQVSRPGSDSTAMGVVMEYCPRSLKTAVMDVEYEPALAVWVKYLYQIASGMRALAREGVIHRDLKPENVLITAADDVAITDFGLATTKSSILNASAAGGKGQAGTMGYMAPETFNGESASELTDVYSFGVLMCFVLCREEPWQDNMGGVLSGLMLQKAIESRLPQQPEPSLFPELSREYLYLSAQCCQRESSLRPVFVEIEEVSRVQLNNLRERPVSACRSKIEEAVKLSAQLDVELTTATVSFSVVKPGSLLKEGTSAAATAAADADDVWSKLVPIVVTAIAGRRVDDLAAHRNTLYARTYDERGKKANNNITIVDLVTRQEIGVLETGHISDVRCLLVHGDTLFTGSEDGTVKAFDIRNNHSLLATMKGHTSFVKCLHVYRSRYLISGSLDMTVKVWDRHTFEEVRTLHGSTSSITCLLVVGDMLYSGSWDKTVRVWDMTSLSETACLEIAAAKIIPSLDSLAVWQHYLFAGEDSNIHVWDLRTNRAVEDFFPEGVYKNGRQVAVYGDILLHSSSILNMFDLKTRRKLTTTLMYVQSLLIHEGKLFVGHWDGTISELCLPSIEANTAPSPAVAAATVEARGGGDADDARFIATADSNKGTAAVVWKQQVPVQIKLPATSAVTDLAVHGSVLNSINAKHITAIDRATREVVSEIVPSDCDTVTCALVHGDTLFIGGGSSDGPVAARIRALDISSHHNANIVASYVERGVILTGEYPVRCLAEHSGRLVGWADDAIRLWGMHTLKEVTAMPLNSIVNALLVVGDVLYAAYTATAVAVFDLKSCQELTRLKNNPAWVWSMVTWQHYLLCLNIKGTVAVWDTRDYSMVTDFALNIEKGQQLVVHGDTLFCAHYSDSFITVYDLRERRSVGYLLSELSTSRACLLVHENTLYAGCSDGIILEFALPQLTTVEGETPLDTQENVLVTREQQEEEEGDEPIALIDSLPTVTLWPRSQGKEGVSHIAVHGRVIYAAYSYSSSIEVVDLAHPSIALTLALGGSKRVTCLLVHNSVLYVATEVAKYPEIEAFAIKNDNDTTPLASKDDHEGTVFYMGVSRNHLVTGDSDGVVIMRELATLNKMFAFSVSDSSFLAAMLVVDGRVFCCPYDCSIHVWELEAARCKKVAQLERSKSEIRCLASWQHYLFAADDDGDVTVWDMHTHSRANDSFPEGAISNCSSMVVWGNRLYYLPHTSGAVAMAIFELVKRVKVGSVSLPNKGWSSLPVVYDGKLYLGCRDGALLQVVLDNASPNNTGAAQTQQVGSVRQVVTVSEVGKGDELCYGSIVFYGFTSSNGVRAGVSNIGESTSPVISLVSLVAYGNGVLSASRDNSIRWWGIPSSASVSASSSAGKGLKNGELVIEMDAAITCLVMVSEHRLAVGCTNGRIHVYDLKERREVVVIKTCPVSALATWRHLLFSANYNAVHVYDLDTFRMDGNASFFNNNDLVFDSSWDNLRIVVHEDLLIAWNHASTNVSVYDLATKERKDHLFPTPLLLAAGNTLSQLVVHESVLYCCCNNGRDSRIYEVDFQYSDDKECNL